MSDTDAPELIDHTVLQQMLSSPFGVEYRAFCSCGFEWRHADIDANIDAIGRHIADTLPRGEATA